MNRPDAISIPSFVIIIFTLQFSLLISIFLDVAIARQVLGFVYLTFVPGYVILRLLKQNNLGWVELILLSVGLSVSFSMISGLLINEIGLLIGINQPLLSNVIIPISAFVIIGTIWTYYHDRQDFPELPFDKKTILSSLTLVLLPVASVIGTFWANTTESNFFLLLALALVLAVFIVTVFAGSRLSVKLIPVIIFSIALTLLLHYSLISNTIQGFDIKVEYFIANSINSNGFWNISNSFTDLNFGRFNSMLSVTILPSIYSNILNMDISWIFKIIYPLIFAFVPVGLYCLWRERFGKAVAFLSAFFLMSQITFYTEMLGLTRQMIAELFFVLLFIILLSSKLTSRNVNILFIILGFSIVASHYSTAIIFGFFILLTWLLGSHFVKHTNAHLKLYMVVLFFGLLFVWYAFTSSAAIMTTITNDLSYVISGFKEFFDPASRGTGVLDGIGLGAIPTPLNMVSRVVAYVTELLVIIGFILLLLERKKPDFDHEYFIPILASITILILCILLPNFANTFNIQRFYHLLLFFLAPLCAYAAIRLFKLSSKISKRISERRVQIYSLAFITILLGSYFLLQTNFVYEVAGGTDSWSMPLSRFEVGARLYTNFSYITEPDVSGALWLNRNRNDGNLTIYVDKTAVYTLVGYGGFYISSLRDIENYIYLNGNDLLYLQELATVYNQTTGASLNIVTSKQPLSIIYNNGYCLIYENTAP